MENIFEKKNRDGLRLKKLASQFRQELAQVILEDIFDERLQLVTLSHVILTPDLHIARIYFTHVNGLAGEKDALLAFKKCKGFLRSQLASRIRLKFTPELEFYYDNTEEMFNSVKDILQKIDSEKNNSSV